MRRVLILILMAAGLLGGLSAALQHAGSVRGYAAPSTPPPPPSYIPTPIGPPPPPPTQTPSPTAVTTPGSTVTPTATALPSATAVATASFTLDAARVAPVNNGGDLSGLVAVRPGTKVWLMMYLTIQSMPKASPAVSTYEVDDGAKRILQAAYPWNTKAHLTGRFSRYISYTIPSGLAYGDHLTLKTTLRIGKPSQVKAWKFVVAKQQRLSTTSRSKR